MTVTINGTTGLATDSTSAVVEAVSLNHPSSSTAAITMDASNNVTLASNLTMTGGVYLGGTGSANLLQDYEEGLHTATLTPQTSGSLTLDSTSNTLSYTKIGRMVHVNGWVQIQTNSSAVGTYVKLSLPFAPADLTNVAGRVGGAQCFIDASASNTISAIGAYVFEGEANIYLFQNASGLASGDDFIIDINFNAV